MRSPLLEQLPAYRHRGEIVVRDFHCELITPMFGGDSKSWELNQEAPVRAQSLKGQLRFWWRAMQSETDPQRLLWRENAVWGGKTDQDRRIQSPVKIAVLDQQVGKRTQAELNSKGFAVEDEVIPTYVAFPVTSAIKKDHKDVCYIEEMRFTLRVAYPASMAQAVLDTLKLWALFGGAGARTRRGCGAVHCPELVASFVDEQAVCSFVSGFEGPAEPMRYPRIQGARLAFAPVQGDAAKAWEELVRAYAGFRQDRRDRRPENPIPGRSYWPEPDAIRILTESHAPSHTPEHPDGLWFPRAAFGLPIITRFNTRGNGLGDPDPPVELLPRNGSRWPSPLILKVVRLADGSARKTALVLNQTFPEDMILKQEGKTYKQEVKTYDIPRSAHPCAIEGKIMKNNDRERRQGETIYQALFRELKLEEAI